MLKVADKNRVIDFAAWALIAVYILFFGYLSFLRYNTFDYKDWDLASNNQALWNIARGSSYSSLLGTDYLGHHAYFILFLILPLYLIFQSPLTLLFLKTLSLGLAAYPVYLIAKSQLNRRIALALIFIYFTYPALGYLNYYEFQVPVFATLFLAWMCYFFMKDNFKPFLLFMFLSIICQENISLLIIMTGVFALFSKREKKWAIVPIISGALWFLLTTQMILPYFNKGRLFFAGIYNHMGANLQEILKFILLNPGKVFAMVATRQNMIFFAKLLLPLSFFPVFNLRILIIAPVLLQHLLSLRQAEHDIYRHYSAELIPFIFISAVYGIKRFLNISYIKSNLRGGVFVCFLIAVAVTTNLCLGPHLFLLYSIGSIKKDVWDYQKEFFLSKIPKDAAVVATFEFLPKLSSRKNLYSFHNVSLGCDNYSGAEFRLPEDVEYALVDFNDSLTFSCFYNGEDSDKRIRDFIKNGGWGVLDISGTIVLMKKRHKDMYNLYKTTKRLPKNLKQCRSSANNELELIGYRIKNKEATAGGERIEIEFYWMVLKDKDSDYFVFSDILDEDGNIYCRYIRPLCYRVFPTYRWAKGQIVKEDYNLMVPYAIRNNSYLIRMGVFDHRDGRVYPMSSALHDSVDENGRVKILWKSPS